VNDSLLKWLDDIEDMVLYPKMSAKTCSLETGRLADSQLGLSYYSSGITQIDLEVILHRHGIIVDGNCEMRQKWYPSNLDPRTYYASGGFAYHRSKYIASIFEMLADTFIPSTKRFCTAPTRLDVEDDYYMLIYDLTSYTSNLHEHKYFLSYLSLACKGTNIYLMTVDGKITYDLGDLIDEYNELYKGIPVNMERIPNSNNSVVYSNVASLLGIYGNISSAKYLHAIVMSQSVHNLDQINTAGDDGIVMTDNEDATLEKIEVLGDIQKEKCYVTYEDGCQHLKRPLRQIVNHLEQGDLLQWPNLEFYTDDQYIDSRYEYIKSKTIGERKDSVSSSITTLLNQLSFMTLSQVESKFMDSFLRRVYREYGLPLWGNVPQIVGSNKSYGFVPSIEGDYMHKDPIVYTITRLFSTIAIVSERQKIVYDNTPMIEGYTFKCNSDKHLSYLEKLGYLESTKRKLLVHSINGPQVLIDEYHSVDSIVYDYVVLYDVPANLAY